MAAKVVRPMSGLQKQVLGLFREALRVARTKDPSVQVDIVATARMEFKKGKELAKTDYERIEYLLRRGKRQLDRIRPDSVVGVMSVDPSR
mmetsp:Transcript_44226/g.105328  ORF Transcript_44226/g.105328 Transcript_44226/m.105328 type:complete len:90 (-) Transcript_44226:90-359(-)